ncbi:MAG: hypothetical protein V2A69_04420 [Pseudomonadota bacterium]
MNSLKSLKMKKVKNVLSSKTAVKNARTALEKKTEEAFRDFARSKQKVRELAHLKYLD